MTLMLAGCEAQPAAPTPDETPLEARGYSFFGWPKGWTDTNDDGLPDTYVGDDLGHGDALRRRR